MRMSYSVGWMRGSKLVMARAAKASESTDRIVTVTFQSVLMLVVVTASLRYKIDFHKRVQ